MILLATFALALLAQDTPPQPVAALRAPSAMAEPIPLMIAEPVAMAIASFDADGDAVVTRAEFAAGISNSFAAVAKGQPSIGYIAFGDWAERWLGNRHALPSPFEVDQDGDNRITLAELQARFDLFFARFDRDKDGVLRRSELLTVRPAAQPTDQQPGSGKAKPSRSRRR